jgi:hypothetical protein
MQQSAIRHPVREPEAMLMNTDFILTLTAFAGLLTHALTTAGAGWSFFRSADAEDSGSIFFWTSDRLSQSGEGSERPFWIE